jgi:hypothetical protein
LLASRCTCGQRPATCGLSISALLAALEPKIGGSCATVGDADADADAEFWRCEKQLLVCVRLLYLLLQNYCYIPPLALPPFAGATCYLAAVLVCCPPTDLLFSIRIRHCASRQKRLCAAHCHNVWVVPDGNLPARKLGLALPAKRSARRTSHLYLYLHLHPPPSPTANPTPKPKRPSLEEARFFSSFTRKQYRVVVTVTSSGSTVSCVTSRASD